MEKIGNWIITEQQRLTAFRAWWLNANLINPTDFPLEMGSGEWNEQYQIWDDGFLPSDTTEPTER